MSNAVIYEKVGSIAKIRLNRPEHDNAITRELQEGLRSAVEQVANDDSVKVAIVLSNGSTFCGGFDVSSYIGLDPKTRRRRNIYDVETWMKIWDCPKPFIAAVNGANNVGGGVQLALVCDMMVMAENAALSWEEYTWNVTFSINFAIDLYKLPMNKVRDLHFLGGKISAEEAYRLGLCTKVVKEAELETTAMAMAKRVLHGAPETTKMIKETLNYVSELQGMRQAISYGVEVFTISRLMEGTEVNQKYWDIVEKEGLPKGMEFLKEESKREYE